MWSEWLVATGFKHFREKVKVQRPFVQTVNFAKAELLWSVGVSSGILNQDEASDLRRIMCASKESSHMSSICSRVIHHLFHAQHQHSNVLSFARKLPVPCQHFSCRSTHLQNWFDSSSKVMRCCLQRDAM